MPSFDGLTLSEMVLLVAGCILFVALLIALFWNTMHKQSVKGLVFFFAFPIVMIGFPTIQSIKIGAEGAEIDNQVAALQQNPNDQKSREALTSKLNDLKDRPFNNPKTLTNIARAEFALGQDADGNLTLQKALNVDPNLKSAQNLMDSIKGTGRLSEQTLAAAEGRANTNVKALSTAGVSNRNVSNTRRTTTRH